MREYRRYQRLRVLKTAKVWFNDFRSVMNCQVRDLSQGGAKVRFYNRFVCPNRVGLYLPYDDVRGEIRLCRIKWRLGTEVGLHFMSAPIKVRYDDVPDLGLPE